MEYVLSLLGPLSQGALVTLKLFVITLALAVPLTILFIGAEAVCRVNDRRRARRQAAAA